MLTESEVIAAVCKHLEAQGYSISQRLTENQRGDDIIAVSWNRKYEVVIEAKGETSSKSHTARFGKKFSSAQVRDHVANAFFRAAQAVETNRLSGMALPRNTLHVAAVEKISAALRQTNIEVFWVSPDFTVKVEGHWTSGATPAFRHAHFQLENQMMTKKPVAKKPAAKKPVAKKAAPKKSAAKKAAVKKVGTGSTGPRKS